MALHLKLYNFLIPYLVLDTKFTKGLGNFCFVLLFSSSQVLENILDQLKVRFK